MTARQKILIVLHQEHSTPGRVGQRLCQRGYELDVRRPRFGDPLPRTMAGHAGAVIFGGPMSANDDDDFIRRETDWIEVPLKEQKPFFGICLGAQMLVRHLGGCVEAHPQGMVEIGYYPLEPTEAGRRLMDWPACVYQWHGDGMSVPAGAVELARGDIFTTQAIQVGQNAFGIQFHTELTLAMLYRWTTLAAHRLKDPGARPRAEHFSGRFMHDRAASDWLDRFLDLWLPRQAKSAPAVEKGSCGLSIPIAASPSL
ncbi:Glutamine amidotransferase, class I [hydrothermal vent metagenome]|uniref:Glutamine amidotransferase, class I n=1 Tax=hydrothermal vent metagenome TaxID=652676 RepID=A0A3B0T9Z8_9ZZZZ